MNIARYIALGVFLTAGLTGCMAGCFIENSAFNLVSLIPMILCLLCMYGAHQSKDVEGGLVTESGWKFLSTTCFAFVVGCPVCLFHGGKIKEISMELSLGGCVVILLGFFFFKNCKKQEDPLNGEF